MSIVISNADSPLARGVAYELVKTTFGGNIQNLKDAIFREYVEHSSHNCIDVWTFIDGSKLKIDGQVVSYE